MVGVCEVECMGRSLRDEPPDLNDIPQLYEACGGWKSFCGSAYNLEGIKGKFSGRWERVEIAWSLVCR